MLVRYIGCSDAQARWGGCNDPREQFVVGNVIELDREEVHKWHTKYVFKGCAGK